MKIGILTHHFINNYGAFLQAYALREAVAKEYPDATVEIIDYINIKQSLINTCGWFRYYRDREDLKCWLQKVKIPNTFSRARKSILHLSPRCFSVSKVNKQSYDVILIGSDEVWNYKDWKGFDLIKFGYGLTCKNIIAYAPSIGGSGGPLPQYVKVGIEKFASISVRDSKTGDMVESVLEHGVPQVLDPTFLISFPRAKKPVETQPYILFYYCDHLPAKIREQIYQHANKKGMAVYGAGECNKRYNKITANLTPFEWVEMVRGAEFVFTGTFHGAVFAILNRKPFKVYLTNKSRIQKVNSLLEMLGLNNRHIDENFVFDYERMKNEIDYEKLMGLLQKEKDNSIDFLHQSIDNLQV